MAASEESVYEPGKLFVGGLSWDTTKEKLATYFAQFGEISDSIIMFDRVTNKPRGFGFVTFANPDDIEHVLQHQGIHTIDTKKVDPKKAKKGGQLPTSDGPPTESVSKPLKVFLGGLPSDATVDDIRKELSKFGSLSATTDAIEIKMDPSTERSRGFGFATFETEDAAQAAVTEHFIYLGQKQVEVKKAEDTKFKSGRSGYPQGYGANRMYNSYPATGGYPPPQQQQQQQGGGYGYAAGGGYPAGYAQQWHSYNEQYGGGTAPATGYYAQPQGSNPTPSYNGAAYGSTGYNTSRTDSTGGYTSAVPQAQGYSYPQQQQSQQLYGYAQQQGYSGRSQEQPSYNNGFSSRQ